MLYTKHVAVLWIMITAMYKNICLMQINNLTQITIKRLKLSIEEGSNFYDGLQIYEGYRHRPKLVL